LPVIKENWDPFNKNTYVIALSEKPRVDSECRIFKSGDKVKVKLSLRFN
jgi:hypothetical protein